MSLYVKVNVFVLLSCYHSYQTYMSECVWVSMSARRPCVYISNSGRLLVLTCIHLSVGLYIHG